MSNGSAIIDALRSSRNADDTLANLRVGSLEARRDRIAEALADPTWEAGPAELLLTYPHHAVATRHGVVMRVRINEDAEGGITLGKVEVHELPQPVGDIGQEVMETAEAVVDYVLSENFAEATPMIATIANALNTEGDLKRRITTEIAKRSIARKAWWHRVVREHLEDTEVALPAISTDDPKLAVEELQAFLIAQAASVVDSVVKLEGRDEAVEEVARDIAADLKYAVEALVGADRENVNELVGVYEGVANVAENLLLGAKFLHRLAEIDGETV